MRTVPDRSDDSGLLGARRRSRMGYRLGEELVSHHLEFRRRQEAGRRQSFSPIVPHSTATPAARATIWRSRPPSPRHSIRYGALKRSTVRRPAAARVRARARTGSSAAQRLDQSHLRVGQVASDWHGGTRDR
jgi:hypothetical protein